MPARLRLASPAKVTAALAARPEFAAAAGVSTGSVTVAGKGTDLVAADPAALPKVLDLARRPNAAIKVSGVCTMSREPFPYPDIWDPLARVFDAWGFERCLWGTDWTRAFAVVNYEQAVTPFLKTDRLSDSERAMLMGGACAKAYRWSPTGRAAR